MEISFFPDKNLKPGTPELQKALGTLYTFWEEIRLFVLKKYPAGKEEWNFPGAKYGWSFRIKDKKRAILYFLPRDGFFKVAFVFGEKALTQILESTISEEIKTGLQNAKKYAEGRGIQIEVRNRDGLADIQKLIEIKLAN